MCKRMRIEIHVHFTEMTNYGCQETCFYCALLTLSLQRVLHIQLKFGFLPSQNFWLVFLSSVILLFLYDCKIF